MGPFSRRSRRETLPRLLPLMVCHVAHPHRNRLRLPTSSRPTARRPLQRERTLREQARCRQSALSHQMVVRPPRSQSHMRAADMAIGVKDKDEDLKAYFRSEEKTSELQSLMRISYAVFCLKKKNIKKRCQTPSKKHIKETNIH